MLEILMDMVDGPVVADTIEHRKLWYRGLTKWVSPTHMALSDLGAREVNVILYGGSDGRLD